MSTQKVALVTGSSRGLGKAMAFELAQQGFAVAVHYAGSKEAAEAVAAEIVASGGVAQVFAANLSKKEEATALIDTVAAAMGSVDVLVNNAGITKDNLLVRMKDEDWDDVMRTNLDSIFYLSRAAIKRMMKAKTGRIINISSVVGLMGNAGQANYVAAKAGVVGFTKSLAKEYGARGITVNAIAPGFIASDMTAKLPENTRKEYLAQIPLGRFGEASEVAKLVAFLASDAASYITGQVIGIDGGMYPH